MQLVPKAAEGLDRMIGHHITSRLGKRRTEPGIAVLGAHVLPITGVRGIHPHPHSLVSDGVWDKQGQFQPFGPLDYEVLTRLFQHRVLEMLTRQRRLSRDFADRLRSWHPSGFQVYRGPAVDRDDRPALERLSAYIPRPGFAGTRLPYRAETGRIQYRTHKGVPRSLNALDWIALVTSRIPDPHQRMVRYGWKSLPSSKSGRSSARSSDI